MYSTGYKIVSLITVYRIAAVPVLLYVIFSKQPELFKWLLAVSFFTDLIDGFIARKLKVASALGSKLDSIGDDLTVLAAIIGLFVFKPEFIKGEVATITVLLSLFILQVAISLIKYRKLSSFHTYLAKAAAVLQGSFFILFFFLNEPLYFLFYAAALITCLELIEEIILVILIPEWKKDVKGLYWVLRKKTK